MELLIVERKKEICRKCKSKMMFLKRPEGKKFKRNQKYYFSHYYVCPKCKNIKHEEVYKQYNPNLSLKYIEENIVKKEKNKEKKLRYNKKKYDERKK